MNAKVLTTLKAIATDYYNNGDPAAPTWYWSIQETLPVDNILLLTQKAGLTIHAGAGENATVQLSFEALNILLAEGFLELSGNSYSVVREESEDWHFVLNP